MTDEETHIDPRKMKMYFNLTPKEEKQLFNLLKRKNNGEYIYYTEIAKKTGVPYEIVVSYDVKNFRSIDN